MEQLKRLIREIHRRSLWQVLAIYVGASWVVFEIVQTVTEGLGLPPWFPAFAALLLLIGLPIVLATAFVQEGIPATPRDDPTLLPVTEGASDAGSDEVGAARKLLTWRNAVTGGVLALALWGVVATGWLLLADRGRAEGENVAGVAESGSEAETGAAAEERPAVAALPFVNRSGLGDDQYFTDGIHDEILTRLSKISSLSVRGRTSVMQYRDTEKNLRQIGEELNARYILEGGVQRAGETVRINVQLVDAASDEHVWAETYDRPLTIENLLEVQSNVALRVAEELKAILTEEEAERIGQTPTDNLEAYEYYLRGAEYLRQPVSEENLRGAVHMFENAIALDAEFPGAHAALSRVYSELYWFYFERSDERLALALEAAHAALEIDPELPDAHLALCYYYYYGSRDYQRALEALHKAGARGLPRSEYYATVANIKRRQGDFDSALASRRSAIDEDPRSPNHYWNLGITNLWMRNHIQAERSYDQALSLAAEPVVLLNKARLYVAWQGNRQKAWESLRTGPTVPLDLMLARHLSGSWALFRILYKDATEAQKVLRAGRSQLDSARFYLAYAEVAGRLGGREEASAHYDSARAVLTSILEERPEDAISHSELGIAYAGLGRHDEAVSAGERAVRLLPLSRDALDGTVPLMYLAQIHTMVGEADSAIGDIEALLEQPGWITTHWLRLDPVWDPLRDHPRFQTLLQRYE